MSGVANVATFKKTELSHRGIARSAGALDDRPSAIGPGRRFRGDHSDARPFVPGVHVNYAETVLPMRDGLPKLKDFPAEFGGSGKSFPSSDGISSAVTSAVADGVDHQRQLKHAPDQAAFFDFATWVAMASISAGDRQS